MSPYVDKSHFIFIKVLGVGTHSVIWLVEKRAGVASALDLQRSIQNVLVPGSAIGGGREADGEGGGAAKSNVIGLVKDSKGNIVR